MTNFYGPSLSTDGDPITYDAQGKPVVVWRSWQRPVTPEPFVDLSIRMHVVGVGEFQNMLWRAVGDHWWSRLTREGRAIMGMHLSQRTIAGGVIEGAVAINNGTCIPGDQSSWCGAVIFDSLTIAAPSGWKLAIEAIPQGPQLFPSLATRIFRLVLYRPEYRAIAGDVLNCKHLRFDDDIPLGPANTLVTWHNGPMPGLDIRGMYGMWTPHGDPAADMVSGTDIYPLHCLGLTPEHAYAHRRRFDLTAQRQRNIAYDANTGQPIAPEAWGHWFELKLQRGVTHDQRNPTFVAGDSMRDPWQEKFFNPDALVSVPSWQALDAYKPHDDAHGCRAIMDAITTAVLCNDVIARLYLQCQANEVMLSMNMTQPGPLEPTYPGEHVRYSMAKLVHETAKYPHASCWEITRAVGWKYTTVAAGLQLTPPSALRDYTIAWANMALKLSEDSTLPSMMPEDGKYPSANNGVPWQPQYGLQTYQGCVASWQVPFWAHGVYSLALQAHGGRMRAATKALIQGSAEALYHDPSWFRSYDEKHPLPVGAPYYAVTSEHGVPVPELTTGSKNSEPLHAWHHLALAIAVAPTAHERSRFAVMAKNVNFPKPTVMALAQALDPTQPWQCGLYAEFQKRAPEPA